MNETLGLPVKEPPKTPHTPCHGYSTIDPVTPWTSRTIPETDFGSSPMALSSPSTVRAGSVDIEMQNADIPIAQDELPKKPAPISRFASLGLNRVPAGVPPQWASQRRYSPTLHNVRKSTALVQPKPPRTTYERLWLQEREDLTELEEMMIPEALRSAYRNRGFLPGHRWQPINRIKTSKYTTGYLTESGYSSIHNPKANDPGDVEGAQYVPSRASTSAEIGNKVGKKRPKASKAFSKVFQVQADPYSLVTIESSPPLITLPDRSRTSKLAASSSLETLEGGSDDVSTTVPDPEYAEQGHPDATLMESLPGDLNQLFKQNKEYAPPSTPNESQTELPSIDFERLGISNSVPGIIEDDAENGENDEAIELAGDHTGKWELLEGNADSPRTGQPAPAKLIIRLRKIETQELEVYNFRKIKLEDINWNDKTHMREISKWRIQIFRHRGFPFKRVVYVLDEDVWLLLFHKKLKAAVEAGSIVKMPGPVPTMEAFNRFFEGKLLKDVSGQQLTARQPRDEQSLKGKLSNKNSEIWKMRDVTRKLLEGKRGGKLYVPVITEDDMRRYQQDGTFTTDDPGDANKNAALGADATRSRRSSPKRKREMKDGGEPEAKRAKHTAAADIELYFTPLAHK